MTQKEFIKELDKQGYSYEIEGDKIIVTHGEFVNLPLISIPSGVVFKNKRWVSLYSLTSIPPGVEFDNEMGVDLSDLIGGWFHEWEGNIEGVNSERLLNSMIKQGVFER